MNRGSGGQVEMLNPVHAFVWAEIRFQWITTAPNTIQEMSDKLTAAIKLSAICEGLGLRLAEVKYILKRKKSQVSQCFAYLSISATLALECLKGGLFSLKESFSIGVLKFQNPGSTPKMNYSLRNPDSNLGVGRAKTPLESEPGCRTKVFYHHPRWQVLFQRSQPCVQTQAHIPASVSSSREYLKVTVKPTVPHAQKPLPSELHLQAEM